MPNAGNGASATSLFGIGVPAYLGHQGRGNEER